MQTLAKFSGPDLDSSQEFVHPNLWQREGGPGWSRLVIGARSGEIPLILELCQNFNGPFGVLYVLVVSRDGHTEGRYQVPEPLSYEELELFLYTFQEFFEQDGRHHLWVSSASDEGMFVFDNHNVIYAYGDLDAYEAHLESADFGQGTLDMPVPHSHHYHFQFDAAEDEVIGYWQWKRFPLQPQDTP